MVPAIEKARLYRGKGGEIMRAAVSRLIECTALIRVPLPQRVQRVLHDSIDDNLKHPNADIQVSLVFTVTYTMFNSLTEWLHCWPLRVHVSTHCSLCAILPARLSFRIEGTESLSSTSVVGLCCGSLEGLCASVYVSCC